MEIVRWSLKFRSLGDGHHSPADFRRRGRSKFIGGGAEAAADCCPANAGIDVQKHPQGAEYYLRHDKLPATRHHVAISILPIARP